MWPYCSRESQARKVAITGVQMEMEKEQTIAESRYDGPNSLTLALSDTDREDEITSSASLSQHYARPSKL